MEINATSSTNAKARVGLLCILRHEYLCEFKSSYSSIASMIILNSYTDSGFPYMMPSSTVNKFCDF